MSGFNTQEVIGAKAMFQNCSKIKNLAMETGTQAKLYMGWMFTKCSALTNIDMFKFNTSNVKSVRSMFQLCSSLTSWMGSFDNVKNVEDMRITYV